MLSSNYKSSNRNVTGASEENRTPVSTLARHLFFEKISTKIPHEAR